MMAAVKETLLPAELVNIEAEAALLGAMMMGDAGNSIIDRVLDRISDDDFAEAAHVAIFQAIRHQHSLGRPANPVTIRPLLAGHPAIEAVGEGYPAQLIVSSASLLHVNGFVDALAELGARRRFVAALDKAREAAVGTDMDGASLAEVIDECDRALTAANTLKTDIANISAAECIEAALRDQDDKTTGITCKSIPSIDKLLGDLRPGNVVVLGARPSMGKTATALSYCVGAARQGHGVLFVSLEMSGLELGQRLAADMCFDDPGGVPFSAIRNRRLNAKDRKEVECAADELSHLPFRVIDAPALSIGRLGMMVRRYVRRFDAAKQKLGLVVVDYLQLLSADEKGLSAYEAASRISRGLKQIAKEHGVAVLALAQLNRAVEGRSDHRPQLSDLRDSGQIEQDADAVLLLFRPEFYLRANEPMPHSDERSKWEQALTDCQGRIEFIVPKCRNGTTGSAQGQFYGQFQAVRG